MNLESMKNLNQLNLNIGKEKFFSELSYFKKLPCLKKKIENEDCSDYELFDYIKYSNSESVINEVKNKKSVKTSFMKDLIGNLENEKFDIHLYLDKENSFVIFNYKTEKGASLDKEIAYAWKGGQSYYLNNLRKDKKLSIGDDLLDSDFSLSDVFDILDF